MDDGMRRIANMRRIAKWCGPAVAVVAVATSAGCSQDAQTLLDRMSGAYRAAERYHDNATVRIHYTRGGKEVDHELPFRVAFERPDRLRVECYDAQVVSDGASLYAAVGDVPGQVLVEPVKSPLSLEQLFSDPHLRSRMSEGEAGCPTQLPLLLADDTVALILSESAGNPRVAGKDTIDGRGCTIVEIDKPDGTLGLWIDDDSSILRRMSLPTAAYRAFLASQIGPVGDLGVIVEFKAASFDGAVGGEAFAFEVPPGARAVSAIEPVESPDPPSQLIGKASPPFTLQSLDGGTVSRESLAGSVAVLEFFFDGCEPCRSTMPRVRDTIKDLAAGGRGIVHHRVSVDDSEVGEETIRDFVAGACGGDPGGASILRDPRSVASAAFEIGSFPAVVVLAPDGTVADVQRGPNGRSGEDLVEVVEAIAAQKPTTEIVRRRFERRLAEYRKAIDVATAAGTAGIPEQVIAPKRQPDRFKLVRAWKADTVSMPGDIAMPGNDIAMPGNIVRLDLPADGSIGEVRLCVLDGWRSIVELDADGKELGRHDLDLPKDAAIGFLRTAVDREGRRWWLGASVGGRQVFVFDDRWRRHAVYPESAGAAHDGVSAAELIDLDGDGTPEIVAGFFGGGGVHGVSLDGKRLWNERSVDTVINMAADGAMDDGRRGVIVVDGRGRLVRIGPDGVAGQPVEVEGGRIQSIHGAPVGISEAAEHPWSFVAIAGESLGRTRLVGIAPDLTRRWELDLPDGIHRDGPIEPVAWADLLGSRRRQWLVAAPDGSVTVAWDDGGVVGRYAHGEPLVGLAGFVSDGIPHLIVATRKSLEALRMEDIALD